MLYPGHRNPDAFEALGGNLLNKSLGDNRISPRRFVRACRVQGIAQIPTGLHSADIGLHIGCSGGRME